MTEFRSVEIIYSNYGADIFIHSIIIYLVVEGISMKSLKIKVPNDVEERVRASLEVCKEFFREEFLQMIQWYDIEKYMGDIFLYGMEKIREDPFAFLDWVRDKEIPVFKEETEGKNSEKLKEEFKIAYT